LAFNNKSLRISDLEEGEDNAVTAATKDIYAQLKKRSVVKSGEKIDPDSGEITSVTQIEKKSEILTGAALVREMQRNRK